MIARLVDFDDAARHRDNRSEIGTFQDLDDAFHLTMTAAVGQPGLHAILRADSGDLTGFVASTCPTMADRSYPRRPCGDRRRAGGARSEAAVAAMRDHLSQTISRAELLRQRHPGYFTSEGAVLG